MRKRSPAMALSAVAVLLALGFAMWHVAHPQRMTPDSMEYTRIAVTMRGASLSVSLTEAALARCASLAADPVGGYATAVPAYGAQAGVAERLPAIASARAGRYGAVPAEWMDPCTAYVLDHPVTDDPRYSRIFDSRPLYPALVAPLLTWWTPDVALVAVSATLAALAGLALYGLALALGWSPWAALLAEVLVFLLPIGSQGARPLTEGTTWLLGTLILLGSAWSTRHRAGGIGLSTVAAILLVLARYPTALFIGLGSLGLALLWLPWRRSSVTSQRPALVGPTVGLIAALVVPPALGWAGGADSLQDVVADHFTEPDRPEPLRLLLAQAAQLAVDLVTDRTFLLTAVGVLAMLGLAIAATRTLPATLAVAVPLLVAVGNVLSHPDLGEARRLFSWSGVTIALSVAALADFALRVLTRRRPPAVSAGEGTVHG